MPRSSRHKSTKHSARDTKEYSDSEKDSSLKDRKGKEETSVRVSKELASGEKRKVDSKDSKDLFGSGNGEYLEEYDSSKRHKERVDDGVNDRWNGGEDDRGEGSKKLKASTESKSKRRDDGEGDEAKRSSGKSEGKHRESSRKEVREGGVDRERKGKEGKGERLLDNQDHRPAKLVVEKTELNPKDQLQSPESESQLERRVRRRRDGSGDGDKHQDDVVDINDRSLLSKADTGKDGRPKDERYRDKYKEDVDRDKKYLDDKKRDEHPARDYTNGRSDDKHLRDEKDTKEIRQKKSKSRDSDRERDHDRESDFDSGRNRDRDRDRYHERDRDRDRSRDYDCDWDWDRDRDRDRVRDRDRNRDRNRDRDRDRDRDREQDQDRDRDHDRDRRDHDRERDRDRDKDRDRDGSHLDDRNARYKDGRGKKRSPDDRDDCNDSKSRGSKANYSDMEKKSLGSGRIEPDADRGRSQSRQAHADTTVSSNRRRTSPSSSSHGGTDEYRHSKQEDLKYRDSVTEQRLKAISSREVSSFSGASERVSKYRSTEKPIKMDDGHLGEQSVERSSSSKASPLGLVERSPSSTSLERRYVNRTGIRRSLDIDEVGRRSSASIGSRELSATEDRLSRDLPLEKPLLDESSQADSSFYNRTSQSNLSSMIPPPPAFRAGVGSPSFMGSLEEDSRVNISARYKRSGDPSMGRGQGNAWRGAPNWSSSVPNGFIPFQHGPPHGGFQAMMQQFPSPSMFGIRPSMEINHSGIPYHIPDVDRFSSHLRPLGWPNMMDASGPHLHGWDGSNGVFRDEPHIYGGSDWDQNRQPMMWNGQNGDVNTDLPAASQKEEYSAQATVDDVVAGQAGQRSQHENNHHGIQTRLLETRSSVSSPAKDSSKSIPKTIQEKTPDPSKISSDDTVAHFCSGYLSKLDISSELAGLELYSHCMGLVDMQQSAAVDKDATMLVNLKDGARAVPKCSNTLLSPSLFPATDESVFKRAMDYYKKQRAEMSVLPNFNSGTVYINSASSQEEVEERVLICNVEKAKEQVSISDEELPNLPPLDQKIAEVVSTATAQEELEDQVSTPSPQGEDSDHTPSLKLEMPEQDFSHDSPEALPISDGVDMDKMTSKQVISEDAEGDCFPTLANAAHAATILPTDSDNMNAISNAKGSPSVYCASERQAFGDAISGPLFFSDGSPKVSGALIPGSNESESVILSRIHHSPESTH